MSEMVEDRAMVMAQKVTAGWMRIGRPIATLATSFFLFGIATGALAADQKSGDPNGATIQWAQTILDAKGLYQGRATGRMDNATASAITAFQRRNNLKATGRLDPETITKLMEGREPPPTVGNLADPTSRAKPSMPTLRESDVKPKAAPAAASVSRESGGDSGTLQTEAPEPARQGAAAAPKLPLAQETAQRTVVPPQPSANQTASTPAAPRPKVTVEASEGASSGQGIPFQYLQIGLLAFVTLLVVGMSAAWWMSGRRHGRASIAATMTKTSTARTAPRREPSLGAAPSSGLRADPGLSAGPVPRLNRSRG